MIGFVDAIKMFYQNYANFSGRADRAQYWWVVLYLFILYIIPYSMVVTSTLNGDPSMGWSIVLWIIAAFNIVPILALSWRRMHDIGKGGGWFFISWVPIIGSIWYLVLTLQPSQPFPNRFGETPGFTGRY